MKLKDCGTWSVVSLVSIADLIETMTHDLIETMTTDNDNCNR